MGFRTKEVLFVIILLYNTVKVTVVVTPLPTAVVVMVQGVALMTPQPWPLLDQVPMERGLLALKGPDMDTVTENDWTEGDVQAEAAVGSEPLAQATTALTCRAAVLSSW